MNNILGLVYGIMMVVCIILYGEIEIHTLYAFVGFLGFFILGSLDKVIKILEKRNL